MKNIWGWILAFGVALIIIALLFGGSSNHDTYWIARGSTVRPVIVAQVDDITVVRYPCAGHKGSVNTDSVCGFYVWKR
jgi:hypothetical protein